MTIRPAPKPSLHRTKPPSGHIPASVKRAVIARSVAMWEAKGFYITDDDEKRGLCENPNCPDPRGHSQGLQWCHRYATGQKSKGMGGTDRICTENDIWRGCRSCHFTEDHHEIGD